MTSGSFQTQPRFLYVELYLKSVANYYYEIEMVPIFSFKQAQCQINFSYSSYEQCSMRFFHKHFSNLIQHRNICAILDV